MTSTLTDTSLIIAGSTAISGATSAGYISNINQNLGSTSHPIFQNISNGVRLFPLGGESGYYGSLYQGYNTYILSGQINAPLSLSMPSPLNVTGGEEITIINCVTGNAVSIYGNNYTSTNSPLSSSNLAFYTSNPSSPGYFTLGTAMTLTLVNDGVSSWVFKNSYGSISWNPA